MSSDNTAPEAPATATYIVRSGASFRLHDGSLRTGGQEIELPQDVAAQHADKLDVVQAPAHEDAQETQPMPLDEAASPASPAGA